LRVSAEFELYPEAEALLAWLERKFGLPPATFAAHRFWHRPGHKAIWIAAADCVPPPGLRVEALGMLVARDPPPRGKPTSVFLQRFAAGATRNAYDLDDADAARFLAGEPLPAKGDEKGYCVVRWRGRVLGCGQAAEGQVRSTLPRAWLEAVGPEDLTSS
jgi:hypothetical protein